MKHNIPALIRSKSSFFISLLFILLIAIFYVMIFGNFSYPANALHSFWLNVFFVNYTFMGDAVFAICLSMFFIFYLKRRQQGMVFLYGFFFTEIMVQVLKNVESLSNPGLAAEQGQYLFLTGGISSAGHSIISGHTAIAFAIATGFIFTVTKLKTRFFILAGAVLLGYSRMYLAQNYLTDVLIGMVTGTVSAIVAVYFAYQLKGYGYYYKKYSHINKYAGTPTRGNVQPV